jgi:plasmid stabilization system protein ParE
VIELRISEAAARSVVEQADYYQEASDLALDRRWEDAVDHAVHTLLRWPERGAPCRFGSQALAGLRWIFVPGFPKHMLFYRYIASEQVVLVVQVLHGARNLETILDEET